MKYLVKYHGGSLEIEANSTREAEKAFEEKYQDVIWAVVPMHEPRKLQFDDENEREKLTQDLPI